MSITAESSFDVSALADHELITPDDATVRLGDLWAERAELILFLRHFG